MAVGVSIVYYGRKSWEKNHYCLPCLENEIFYLLFFFRQDKKGRYFFVSRDMRHVYECELFSDNACRFCFTICIILSV